MASAQKERRTQAERSALSDQRIAKAAIALIAQQGYSKTTLAQIGKAAGYTGGLVSHRFGSKEGLLRELVGRIAGRFFEDQILPAVEGRSGLDAVCQGVDAYLHELRVREERIRALYVLMGEALGPLSDVRSIFAELDRGFRAMVHGFVQQGIDAGEIRAEVDAGVAAAAVVASLRGTALQWLMEPGCFDLDGARSAMKDALRRSLAP